MLSHKALRLAVPAFLAVALVSSLMLATAPFYALAFAAQLVFYAAAALGAGAPHLRRYRLIALPYTVCFLAVATGMGFVTFVTRRHRVTWDRGSVYCPPTMTAPPTVAPRS